MTSTLVNRENSGRYAMQGLKTWQETVRTLRLSLLERCLSLIDRDNEQPSLLSSTHSLSKASLLYNKNIDSMEYNTLIDGILRGKYMNSSAVLDLAPPPYIFDK